MDCSVKVNFKCESYLLFSLYICSKCKIKKVQPSPQKCFFSFLTQSGIYTFCSRYVTTANPSWQAYAVTSHRPSPTNLITWRVNRLQRLPFGQFTPVHFQLLILLPPFFFLSFKYTKRQWISPNGETAEHRRHTEQNSKCWQASRLHHRL